MNIESLELKDDTSIAFKTARLFEQEQILALTNADIQRLTNLHRSEVDTVKDNIANSIASHCVCQTALQLFQMPKGESHAQWKLSTGCHVMDKMLRGGFLSGVLSEVTGESACGKTQLCLQLCLSVQVNKERTGCGVYICTEDVFPSKRLQELIRHKSREFPGHRFGDNIFIEHIADFENLDFCVETKLPALLRRGDVRLVVVDSVTALFRTQYDSSQTFERAKHLNQLGTSLQRLASQHNIPVICINQVSASFSDELPNSVIPALGLTWSHQVMCRLMLSRPSPFINITKLQGYKPDMFQTFRILKILHAPHLPNSEMMVSINWQGIHGVS